MHDLEEHSFTTATTTKQKNFNQLFHNSITVTARKVLKHSCEKVTKHSKDAGKKKDPEHNPFWFQLQS